MDLPTIRDNWRTDLKDRDLEGKLCNLQQDLNCIGWYPGCPQDSSVWSKDAVTSTPSGAMIHQRQQANDFLGSGFSTSASDKDSDSSGGSVNGTSSTSTSEAPSDPDTEALRMQLMCPICASNPSTNTSCLTAIRKRVDEVTPIITGGSFGMLILLAGMLAWSWKIRRKARRGDTFHEPADDVNQGHPYKYL